jgi:hypothetical protein
VRDCVGHVGCCPLFWRWRLVHVVRWSKKDKDKRYERYERNFAKKKKKMRDYTPTVNERNLVHATSAYLELLAAAVAYVGHVGHVGHVEEPGQVQVCSFFAWLLSPSQKKELFALRKYMEHVQTGLPGLCRGALEWADVFMPTLRTALATATALHQRCNKTVVDSFLTLPNKLGPAHVAEWEHADPTWTHVVVKTGYLLSETETTLWRVCIFVNGKQIIHSI